MSGTAGFILVTHWPNSDVSLCQLGVVGVHDGTRVDITFPANEDSEISVEFEGRTYTNGDRLTVVINRYSTLQIQSKGMQTVIYRLTRFAHTSVELFECNYLYAFLWFRRRQSAPGSTMCCLLIQKYDFDLSLIKAHCI